VEIADDAVGQPLVLEHEKPAVKPDVEAPASVPYQLPWSRLGFILLIELAWLSLLGYFVDWLAT
jgi:hypothetical protein